MPTIAERRDAAGEHIQITCLARLGMKGTWLPDPIVIGATGGSGTRVIARVLQRADVFMGSDVSGAMDSLPFAVFLDVWANVYSSRSRILTEEEARSLNAAMARSLLLAIDDHFGGHSPTTKSWGWKEPNSIYLLPFLHDQLPEIRFVHLVRDGRDMAFSDNQSQLIKHGRSYLESLPQRYHGQHERSVALWAVVNSEAADYGERVLGDKYLQIKFEDLCSDPVSVVSRLYDFTGLTADVERIAREEVTPPSSLGRWRQQNARVLGRIEMVAELAPALARFGYGA